MRSCTRFLRDQSGATLVEYTLVFTLMMVLTFGLIEFGLAFYQYNAAEKATAIGARFLATRGPVVTGLGDCAPANTNASSAGTYCSTIGGSTGAITTCSASAPSGGCQAAVLNALVARMQQFAPNIEAQNVQVQLRGAGLGFVGRGSPVPLITVRLTGMTYDFVALDDLLGFSPITMPAFDATIVGEDLNGAGA
ncbi:MAG: TadE/TadG family type IV pilus assembly protein [Hyphomonadaceae bacterium]|nr:TadE/TadG family type IV pilus assembly protein [Hyphomonadaceae bacterium]